MYYSNFITYKLHFPKSGRIDNISAYQAYSSDPKSFPVAHQTKYRPANRWLVHPQPESKELGTRLWCSTWVAPDCGAVGCPRDLVASVKSRINPHFLLLPQGWAYFQILIVSSGQDIGQTASLIRIGQPKGTCKNLYCVQFALLKNMLQVALLLKRKIVIWGW